MKRILNSMRFYKQIIVALAGVLLITSHMMGSNIWTEGSLRGKKVLYVYGGWEGHEPEKCRDIFVPG